MSLGNPLSGGRDGILSYRWGMLKTAAMLQHHSHTEPSQRALLGSPYKWKQCGFTQDSPNLCIKFLIKEGYVILVLGKAVQPLGIFHTVRDTTLPNSSSKLSATQFCCQEPQPEGDVVQPQRSLVIEKMTSVSWTGRNL